LAQSLAAVVGFLILLAGCGGAGSTPRADDGANAILASAKRALLHVRGYHLDGVWRSGSASERIRGDLYRGDADVTVSSGGQVVRVRVVDGVTYMRGKRARWSHSADWRERRMADALADRWVRSPGLTSIGVTLWSLQAPMIGRCLEVVGGRLVMGPTRMVDGRRVVVLRDVGDPTELRPAEIWVAAQGAPFLLRVTRSTRHATSFRVPPSSDPACNSGSGTATPFADVRFSAYDQEERIAAPANPVSLAAVRRQAEAEAKATI
jgi:hypothetical protein